MANISSINGNPIVVGTNGISDGTVTDVKLAQSGGVLSAVGSIRSAVFEDGGVNVNSIQGANAATGTNASASTASINLSNNSGFDTYWFVAGQNLELYFEDITAAYVAICYGAAYTGNETVGNTKYIYCTSPTRVRTTDNNLPTPTNKLSISAGSAVAISVTAGAAQRIYGLWGSLVVNDDFARQVTSGIPDDTINDRMLVQTGGVLERVNETFAWSDGVIYNFDSTWDQTWDNAYFTIGGSPVSANGYVSLGLEIEKNTSFYVVSPSGTYFSVCVYPNSSHTNGVRYRRMSGEDTLPYQANPLSLTEGQYIIISVYTSHAFSVMLGNYEKISTFNGTIPLAQQHIDQVTASLGFTMFFRYVGSSGSQSSTERVEVFVPCKAGYVRYDLLHCVVADTNCDVWRVGSASATDASLSEQFGLTTAGEWECAVHLKDRNDFSGGYAHGDEVYTDIVFMADGEVVDITDYENITSATELCVVQKSTLYDPDDSTTAIATHGSEHVFTSDGLTIRQSVLWLEDLTVTTCYLAMLPAAKSVTDSFYLDSSVYAEETSDYYSSGTINTRRSDTKRAVLFGSESGVKIVFDGAEFPSLDTTTFILTDNGGGSYHKCYFVTSQGEHQVTNGTLWKSTTKYDFKVGAQPEPEQGE